jgi:hypothetical protein
MRLLSLPERSTNADFGMKEAFLTTRSPLKSPILEPLQTQQVCEGIQVHPVHKEVFYILKVVCI